MFGSTASSAWRNRGVSTARRIAPRMRCTLSRAESCAAESLSTRFPYQVSFFFGYVNLRRVASLYLYCPDPWCRKQAWNRIPIKRTT